MSWILSENLLNVNPKIPKGWIFWHQEPGQRPQVSRLIDTGYKCQRAPRKLPPEPRYDASYSKCIKYGRGIHRPRSESEWVSRNPKVLESPTVQLMPRSPFVLSISLLAIIDSLDSWCYFLWLAGHYSLCYAWRKWKICQCLFIWSGVIERFVNLLFISFGVIERFVLMHSIGISADPSSYRVIRSEHVWLLSACMS